LDIVTVLAGTHERAYHALPPRPTCLSSDKLLLVDWTKELGSFHRQIVYPPLESALGDTGSVRFLHPIECGMLPVLDLDPVL
jgi:hypothetical protein